MRGVRWSRTLLHVATAFFILRFRFPRGDHGARRAAVRLWSTQLLAILAVDAHCEGEPVAQDGAVVVVANHVSWLDVFALSSVRPTRFIAKSEIRDWPVAGWITEKAGTLFIRRARRHDTARINAHVHAALAEGDCVGFFPEGTTTEGDTLLKFHSSLFEPAVANAARVQPVAIRYEYPDGTLCRAMGFVGELTFGQSMGLIVRQKKIVARVRFAEPIETAGLARREVADLARRRIATLLGLDPEGTPPGTAPGLPGAPR